MYQEAFIDLQLFFEIVACIRLYKARYISSTYICKLKLKAGISYYCDNTSTSVRAHHCNCNVTYICNKSKHGIAM